MELFKKIFGRTECACDEPELTYRKGWDPLHTGRRLTVVGGPELLWWCGRMDCRGLTNTSTLYHFERWMKELRVFADEGVGL